MDKNKDVDFIESLCYSLLFILQCSLEHSGLLQNCKLSFYCLYISWPKRFIEKKYLLILKLLSLELSFS